MITNVNALTSLLLYARNNPNATPEQLASVAGQPAHIVRHWLFIADQSPDSSYGHFKAALSAMGWRQETDSPELEAERKRSIAAALSNANRTPATGVIHH